MGPLTYIVMLGWIPVVLYLLWWLPARQAIVVSFITAWLLLPQAVFELPGIPDYTKISATCYGILLATIVFDVKRFSSFQLGWLDLPMIIWCVCPFASSITNNLGLYDGMSAVLSQTVASGLPYFLGRIYLNNLDGLRKLAMGIFIGGLLYIPLCLFEVRMSWNLHNLFYGFNTAASSYLISLRYGGYRPSVFMESGLTLGAWMMAAALIGVWLWNAGVIRQLWGIAIGWLVAALLITFVLVKATGAWILLAVGIIILFVAKWLRTSLLLLFLIVSIWSYIYVGATGNFSGDQIVSVVSEVIDEERAGSLRFRFDNEEILSAKARQRMIFGWGGSGDNRVYDEWGKDVSITDSLWILAFGAHGVVGLISITASLLLPVIGFLQRYPASLWFHPKVAPAAALAVVLVLYMVDCVLNAISNPVYMLACGGIAGLVLKPTRK